MEHSFQITPIQLEEVQHLFKLADEELQKLGIRKMVVDAKPGFPCRLSLQDANIGEEVLLFTYEHHRVKSPYRSSGPVFIRTSANQAHLKMNEIPKMLTHRLLSLRVYDKNAMMIDARTIKGNELENGIQEIFNNDIASYMQIHNASPGCYNCQVNRVELK